MRTSTASSISTTSRSTSRSRITRDWSSRRPAVSAIGVDVTVRPEMMSEAIPRVFCLSLGGSVVGVPCRRRQSRRQLRVLRPATLRPVNRRRVSWRRRPWRRRRRSPRTQRPAVGALHHDVHGFRRACRSKCVSGSGSVPRYAHRAAGRLGAAGDPDDDRRRRRGGPALTVAERVDLYSVDVGSSWRSAGRSPRTMVPFISGGAGYAGAVHEGLTLLENGALFRGGGGIKYPIAMRTRGRLKARPAHRRGPCRS